MASSSDGWPGLSSMRRRATVTISATVHGASSSRGRPFTWMRGGPPSGFSTGSTSVAMGATLARFFDRHDQPVEVDQTHGDLPATAVTPLNSLHPKELRLHPRA